MNLLVYLMKVILVSAIFFGYYRLFLRNKRFHHYNRFFLLSALLLSIVLPFIRIPFLYEPQNPVNEAVYRTVAVINTDYGEEELAMAADPVVNESVFTLVNSIYLVYAIGAMFLLTLVIKSLLYINSLRRRYPAEKITSLRFYNTREPGTPFSFFRSIFWNDQLSFNSHEGQQIFRHELFHVQHRHSADRLLSELLTAVFWFNPFFHLIKKELKAIHEFLADQFAVSESDRYAYATLLVQQALESGKHAVTNHFFQNHIKRRIVMITQFQQSNYGYWSRVMILPVSLLLFFAITLYAKKPNPVTGSAMAAAVMEQPLTLLVDAGHGGIDNGVVSQDGSVKEKDLTLQLSRKLQEVAARMNINVVMSREGDHLAGNKATGPEALRYTTSLIAAVKPDVVVSLHIGTVYAENESSSKNGIDLYITDRNKASMQSSRLLGERLIGSLGQVYTVNPVLRQRKSKGIWVLDNSAQPTVLIECGYLSSEKDLAFISDEANQEKIANAILQGIINFKKAGPVAEELTDTIPGKEARERELRKRQEEIELIRKKMEEEGTITRKAQMEELEMIKKQMHEQEILSREQEEMRKRRVQELNMVKKELMAQRDQMQKERTANLQRLAQEIRQMEENAGVGKQDPKLEEARKHMRRMQEDVRNAHEDQKREIEARLRDIEAMSGQQKEMQENQRADLENMKSKMKEREAEMKNMQRKMTDEYRNELRKELQKNRDDQDKKRELRDQYRKAQDPKKDQQEKNREEKKDRENKDNEPWGLKPQHENWPVRTDDSLLVNVVRHYLRSLRYPGVAMKHSAEGQIYFSVVVDRLGYFKDFNAYTDKPEADNIKDLVVIGKTPVAVTEEHLGIAQAKDIFTEEVKRATNRPNLKPVVHPEERKYYFRAIFKFDNLDNDNTFRFDKSFSLEKVQVINVSHDWSGNISIHQDTIPAKKSVKPREAKLSVKATAKSAVKATAKAEAKAAAKAEVKAESKVEVDNEEKPAGRAEPLRPIKPVKERTSIFERKGKEPRKPIFADRKSKLFSEKKSSIFNSPKKMSVKPVKPSKPKPVDGSGKVTDEQEESVEIDNSIIVTGEK